MAKWRQIFDVAPTPFNVTGHCTLEVRCQCSQVHIGTFPEEVTETVQYSANVRILGAHLIQRRMLPYARAAELIEDMYGLSVSPGTLVSWLDEASVALQGTAGHLRNATLLNTDESDQRVAGKSHGLHIAIRNWLTWPGMHARRGGVAIAAHGILPKRMGVLLHDCWSPYWKLDDCIHAWCNAHLLRELLYVKDTADQQWLQSTPPSG